MTNVLGMILAGGEGSRLRPLTESRSKPAVPFGGSYRLLDFALNNFINSSIFKVYVLTQFKSQSLLYHMRRGWNFSGIIDNFIEPLPAQMRVGKRWYEGTADAVYQNIRYIEKSNTDFVCIFGSDHIYKMDIRQMLDFHQACKAVLTVAAIRVPLESAHQFGVIEVDEKGRMIGFEEKPTHPKPIPNCPDMALASMGNYIFNTQDLCAILRDDANDIDSNHDFGKDIIPNLFGSKPVYVYDFSHNKIAGENEHVYWRDVGTIDSYWQTHMDLLKLDSPFTLYNPKWPLHTHHPSLPPAMFSDSEDGHVNIINSLVSAGSYVRGAKVEQSILGFNCNIASGCELHECVLLGQVKMGEGCILNKVVVDKNVTIGPGVTIGINLEKDKLRFPVSDNGVVVIPQGNYVE